MRAWMATVGGALLLSTTAPGLALSDLVGTAYVGQRPEHNAVVWLDAPTAPGHGLSLVRVLYRKSPSIG